MKNNHWVKKMNDWGKEKTPFFFVIDFLGTNGKVIRLDKIADENIQVSFPYFSQNNNSFPKNIEIIPKIIPFETYQKKFEFVQNQIHLGNSYLVNLTVETPIETQATLAEIYESAQAKYKIKTDDWVCFSPETFIQIDAKNRISTFPMKGTIDANLPKAQQLVLENKKEKSEHYTIVDLLRNDLSQIADNVSVERFRYIDEINAVNGKILQVSSEITGILPENWHKNLGDYFALLLPAGSISGAPKPKTLEIIQNAENYSRGFYTGVAGIYDGKKLDSCVLIRFIEKTKNGLVYKSGGGITYQSNVQDEYNEIQQKIYVPIS